ncbi:hypothetical protein [Algicola sagamiensis]|uniref:hypothetical protein n=1 Tax=Algicola sagamiensis TaxID=163869 RepID=UPI00037F66EF|nr:hypothetical protein [Algicola sagamiensis]
MQPINANNALDALHTLYVAGTGGGKTTAVKKLGPKEKDQVVFWDPHQDYDQFRGRPVRRYTCFKRFFQALHESRKSLRGFKIALTVEETRKNFLKFCEIVKTQGDGDHPKRLHVVIEELPQVTEGIGKEKGSYGWLMTVGRKFGFIVHSIGQRTTEMSKTTLSQSPIKWIGIQNSRADAKRMADEADIPIEDILALQPLQYFLKKPGIGNYTKGKLSRAGLS